MAQIIIRVGDLATQLEAMTASVEAHSARVAAETEKLAVERDREVNAAKMRWDLNGPEWKAAAIDRRNAANKDKRWWQRSMTMEEAFREIALEAQTARREEISRIREKWLSLATPTDNLWQVHQHLLALCKRLNHDDEILLSERETYAFEQMLELPDA